MKIPAYILQRTIGVMALLTWDLNAGIDVLFEGCNVFQIRYEAVNALPNPNGKIQLQYFEKDQPTQDPKILADAATVQGYQDVELLPDQWVRFHLWNYAKDDNGNVVDAISLADVTLTPSGRIIGEPMGNVVVDGSFLNGEPVDFQRLPVRGSLTLKNMDFRYQDLWGEINPKVMVDIEGRVTFENCMFYGLSASGTSALKGELIADSCEFTGIAAETATGAYGLAKARFNHCRFDGSSAFGSSPKPLGTLEVNDSLFFCSYRAPVVYAKDSCRIEASEFYRHQTTANEFEIRLLGASADIRNNVFSLITGELAVSSDLPNPPMPAIARNSFIGGGGLRCSFLGTEQQPVVWDNYWGSASGPLTSQQLSGWLVQKGVSVSGAQGADTFLTSGHAKDRVCTRTEPRPFPGIWVADQLAGQNTLFPGNHNEQPPLMRQKRDTLVCFDVRTTAEELDGVRYWLEVGGEKLNPADTFKVRRDYASLRRPRGKSWIIDPNRTLNFIIPARLSESSTNVAFKLFADVSQVGGYTLPSQKQLSLASGAAMFSPAPRRPLKIGVLPVGMIYYWSPYLPKGDSMRTVLNTLREEIVGMWPLASHELQAELLQPYHFRARAVGWIKSLPVLNNFFLLDLFGELRLHMALLNASDTITHGQPFDFLVGVLPLNTTGDSGVNGPGVLSRVSIIDEGQPTIAMHELGHALGLYRGDLEQYELPQGPDQEGNYIGPATTTPTASTGAILDGITLFDPEGPALQTIFRQPTFPLQRWYHFPKSSLLPTPQRPYPEYGTFYDIMSEEKSHWIVPSSLRVITRSWIELMNQDPAPPAPVPPGHVRVVFSGRLQPQPQGTYQLNPDSLSWWLLPGSMFKIAGTETFGVTLRVYGATGALLLKEDCRYEGNVPDPILWQQAFDIPNNAARYDLLEDASGRVLFSRTRVPSPLDTKFLTPPNNNLAGNSVQLSWVSGQGPGLLGFASATTTDAAPDLQHQVFCSLDGQRSWHAVSSTTTETSIELSTQFLPASDHIAFKVVSTDGFVTSESVLSGLRMTNHPPSVSIELPETGDQAGAGFGWDLVASASDVEDGAILSSQWTSSLDGPLGTNAVLNGVRLSPGQHTLTFSATDRHQAATSASVTVTVGTMDSVDLAIVPENLEIRALGLAPNQQSANIPQIGQTNRIALTVRNPGVSNAASILLFLTAPGSTETNLANRTVDWTPFEEYVCDALFVPAANGTYRIRARIQSIGLPDRNPTNNQYVWVYTNQPPIALGASITADTTVPNPIHLWAADPEDAPLTYSIVTAAQHGVLTGNPPDLTYTSGNYVGPDSFSYRVSDGDAVSELATIDIQVRAPNDPGNPQPTSPRLAIRPAGPGRILLSWPSAATNYVLESTLILGTNSQWSLSTNPPTSTGTHFALTNRTDQPQRFFRLKRP